MAKYIITVNKNLSHAGIKGMKWGRRRFQNEDGSLTEAGRKRYGVGDGDSDSSKTSNTKNESGSKSHPLGSRMDDELTRYKSTENEIRRQQSMSKASHDDKIQRIRDKYGLDKDGAVASPEAIGELRAENDRYTAELHKYRDAREANTERVRNMRKQLEEEAYEKVKNESESGDSKSNPGDLVPYNKSAKRDEPDYEDKTEHFKPGDDGYEIHNAPKNDSGSDTTSKSKPKDVYDVDFEDKTAGKKDKSGKTKTEKEAEEAHKRAEERKKEAEKNRKDEEAEKKENAKEREKNKKEREKEEEEAHKRGEERMKEAEKNRKEEEVDRQRQINALHEVSELSKDARKITNEIAGISERARVNVPRLNLSHMTNKEMQDAINRELIEKQYDSLFNTTRNEKIARQERTTDFIKNAGAVITVIGGAAAIAERIYKWTKG